MIVPEKNFWNNKLRVNTYQPDIQRFPLRTGALVYVFLGGVSLTMVAASPVVRSVRVFLRVL